MERKTVKNGMLLCKEILLLVFRKKRLTGTGVCQDSCREFPKLCMSYETCVFSVITILGCSGLSQTSSSGIQLRISLDQRSGCAALAFS